jgi:hypothetical protein
VFLIIPEPATAGLLALAGLALLRRRRRGCCPGREHNAARHLL